jgi:hypothetical protein
MIDPQMPEPDGRAETNKERHPEGGYTFDEVPAWSEPLVRAYAEALAAHRVALAVAAKQAESAALKREAHTWSKAAETYAKPRAPLTRQQIDDVMTQHYPLSSLLREEVDAFEACVRDIERLHGIGA